MPKTERLYSAEEAAYMTRLTLSSFRTKVSRLGVKGVRQGNKVFYSRKQVEAIYHGKVKAQTKKTKGSRSKGR